jgi:hypothetical protein
VHRSLPLMSGFEKRISLTGDRGFESHRAHVEGDRGFESISLHRRVLCELDFLAVDRVPGVSTRAAASATNPP